MKHLQQSEKHLADKLQHLPAPDVEQSWEKMRKLLDRDMPEAAGAGWAGNGKWWWMGITAGIVMLAVWLSQEFNQSNQPVAEQSQPATTQISKAGNKTTGNASDKQTSQQNISSTTAITSENTGSESQSNTAVVQDRNDNSTDKNENKRTNYTRTPVTAYLDPEPGNTKKQNTSPASSVQKNNAANDISKNDVISNDVIKSDAAKTDNAKTDIVKSDGATSDAIKPVITKPGEAKLDASKNAISKPDAITKSDAINTLNEERSIAIATIDLAANDDMHASPSDVFNTLDNTTTTRIIPGKTDRAFTREMRKKYMKEDNRKMSRSSMGGRFGEKEHDITFAAGLALPQSFAVSGQQASPYNVAARNNRFTDYLPAPFFQYHINPKVFVQTEFHFQSPQYTERLLLSKRETTFGSITQTSNTYLEKLYYFNIPFNVYYSPARNFYVGGGLQYSSLLSGVATHENRRMNGQTQLEYNSYTQRFKDDSSQVSFAPSEWRYQFDANYNINRFSLGIRYNRAMKDFISIRPNPSLPLSTGRNAAFLLYLRFNIWEERRKD